jgi:hypothetical protein
VPAFNTNKEKLNTNIKEKTLQQRRGGGGVDEALFQDCNNKRK